MTDTRLLKQKRAQIKGQVTRIYNYFETTESPSSADAQVRLTRLQELWDRFEDVQSEIESKLTDEAIQDGSAEKEETERTQFENGYFKVAGRAQAFIDAGWKMQAQARLLAVNQQLDGSIERATPSMDRLYEEKRNKTKLPEIKLPEFTGEYTKWMFFKNSFETTIHKDDILTPMQKHQYLVGVLKGEALQVIQGFSITDENYENAWQLLKNTYDNQLMIIETHLNEIFNFPVIKKEDKADSIRKFVWHIHTHVKSLAVLQQPVAQWETIIIHLAKKRLDFVEQCDWQNLTRDRTPQNMPKLEEFLKFLTERSHSLRVLRQSKEKTADTTIAAQVKRDRNKVILAATSGKCKICEGNHAIYKCEELLRASATDRMTLVRDKKLCINCLGTGHYALNYKASKCKKCSGRHNTILHRDVGRSRKESERADYLNTSLTVQCQENTTEEVQNSASRENKDTSVSVYHVQKKWSRVILSTARVNVLNEQGNKYPCRALLDSGSQSNIITEDFMQKCNLHFKKDVRPISGVN